MGLFDADDWQGGQKVGQNGSPEKLGEQSINVLNLQLF